MSAGFMGIYLHRFANGKWTPTEMTKGRSRPVAEKRHERRRARQARRAEVRRRRSSRGTATRSSSTSRPAAWAPPDDRRRDHRRPRNRHVDIDGDGRDEVIAGQRGGARSLMLYTASPDGATWTQACDRRGWDGRRRVRGSGLERRQTRGYRVHRHRDGEPEVVRKCRKRKVGRVEALGYDRCLRDGGP